MSDDAPKPTASLVRPAPATLEHTRSSRERVIAALSDAFANDRLDVDEFERRVTVAQTSESPSEIDALVADLGLGVARAPEPAARATAALVPAAEARDQQSLYAILGGIDRTGNWTMPRHLRVVTVMGGARLDLREARFPAGVIDIEVVAFMGGTEIIVPPGLAVQTHGTAIMGGFQEVNRAPAHPDPEAPLLRVHGFAMMGGVDIKMRLPGEGERAAHRREKLERHAEKRAQHALDRAERRETRALDRSDRRR
jgi:hypothetical protein